MKKAVLFCLFLSGCGTYPEPSTKNVWNPPPRIVHLDVTVGKYDYAFQCTEKGGTWVVGDTKQYNNAIVGCVEPPEEK